MALWNHLVPELVQLGVRERETDKLPHSRYPSSPPAENEYDSYQTDKKKSVRDQVGPSEGSGGSGSQRQPTSTMGRERIAEVRFNIDIEATPSTPRRTLIQASSKTCGTSLPLSSCKDMTPYESV